MTLRTGHGNGRGVPRIEVMPADELPAAMGSDAAPPQRDKDGRFLPGNRSGSQKRLRVGPRGLTGIDRTSPEFRIFANWGARYGAHRRRELAALHGGAVSAGVGTIIESAALALAASRYLSARGAETGDPELFRQSSTLASTARQHELAAWELAAREAAARPKTPDAAPWLMTGGSK